MPNVATEAVYASKCAKSVTMIYEEFFLKSWRAMDDGGDYVDLREVNIKQRKRSFLLIKKCYAIGSGHSMSSDTVVNTNLLIKIWTCMKERL